jgi:hypothetical protein
VIVESPGPGKRTHGDVEFSPRILVDRKGLLIERKNLKGGSVRGSWRKPVFGVRKSLSHRFSYGFELRRGAENLDLAYRVKVDKGGCVPGLFGRTTGEDHKKDQEEDPK